MPFPTLSRCQDATPSTHSKRTSRHVTSPISTPKVSSHKIIRTESLRSTWMTDDSESMVEDEQDLDDQIVGHCNECQVLVQSQRSLSDWVYWQRDAEALPDCWTRVFAVFNGNILWLYRYEDASARSLLVRMHVTALDVGADTRQLLFRDAGTSFNVQLCLPDTSAFCRWYRHVATAVAELSVVKDDVNAVVVSTMTSTVQKKSFWKELATVVLKGNKYQCAPHENAVVLFNRQNRKSLGQRWKNATTAFKSALKLDNHFSSHQV